MKTQEEVTRIGNPRKPEGTEGEEMLERMNQSHYEESLISLLPAQS